MVLNESVICYLATGFVNFFIVYCIHKEILEYIKKRKKLEKSKQNLLSENINIYLDEYEVEMLSELSNLRSKGDYKKFLRAMILDTIEENKIET